MCNFVHFNRWVERITFITNFLIHFFFKHFLTFWRTFETELLSFHARMQKTKARFPPPGKNVTSMLRWDESCSEVKWSWKTSKINSEHDQVQLYLRSVALIYDSAASCVHRERAEKKKPGEIFIRNSRENLRALIPGLRRPAKRWTGGCVRLTTFRWRERKKSGYLLSPVYAWEYWISGVQQGKSCKTFPSLSPFLFHWC